jgi:NADPH-dependent glutamate synthase beta subunit-like oxidoreductase
MPKLRFRSLTAPRSPLGRLPLPFETSHPGLFAAGDVRAGSIKRVAAAVGEGSAAVRSVHECLAFAHANGTVSLGQRPSDLQRM